MGERKVIIDSNNKIYLDMIESGYSPEYIKEMVIEEFNQFFVNKEILQRNAIEVLLPELINLIKLKQYEKYYQEFIMCVDMYTRSMNIDREECFKAFANWSLDINKAINKYWIIYNLDRVMEGLTLEEYVEVTFKNIGKLIEGVIKPYLFNILNNIYIIKGEKEKIDTFKKKDLGVFFEEIIQSNMLGKLFNIQLETIGGIKQIKLNQLRNIVAHENYEFEGNVIKCFIKKKNEVIDSFSISIEQLKKCFSDVYYTLGAIKLAYTIFFIDNIDEIIKYNPDKLNIRVEQQIVNTFLGIQSQGFKIIDFVEDSMESKLILQDILCNDEKQRMIHSSQFLFRLWEITKAKNNIIEYLDNTGNLKAIFQLDSDVCEHINNGELELLSQAELMKIKII
ncbi:hypothetical protein ACV6CB_001423 [Clostridium perfringens]|uniref:hypothetical protein n=1 Tax=Clostridium perfringens TaxID=1502 RepID=UPI001910FF31|nr:hypothetical protein [Clostridium perfringens]MDK0662824.1 hypothetical protein [Clostridium perfringens]MDK0885128.1 hypothetical protein [Clostridium perfringens]MDU6313162.1 hypothetical protein [Clostridium perfringens]QQA12235.1 hypothetical protein I6G89_00865 [Clostridium perfringens]